MIVVPFAIFCTALLALCLVLLGAGIGRLVRTPRAHADRAARWDTVRLLGVVSGSLTLAALRTQFLSDSRPFLILSAALIPCGIAALWLMVRLIGAYRRDKERPADQTLPDLDTLQSRISPLSMERNHDDSRRNPGP